MPNLVSCEWLATSDLTSNGNCLAMQPKAELHRFKLAELIRKDLTLLKISLLNQLEDFSLPLCIELSSVSSLE